MAGRRSLRTVAVVAALAVAAAVFAISPVGAAFQPTKKAIKKIAKKVAKKQINSLVPGMINAKAGRVGVGIEVANQVPNTAAGFATLASTQVVAPAPGFLILNGSTDSFQTVGPDLVICDLAVNGTQLASSVRFIELNLGDFQAPDSNGDTEEPLFVNSEENCETHTVVPVNAGTYSVAFRVANCCSDGDFEATVVSAEYVPFNGAGAPPSSFTPLSKVKGEVMLEDLAAARGLELPRR